MLTDTALSFMEVRAFLPFFAYIIPIILIINIVIVFYSIKIKYYILNI